MRVPGRPSVPSSPRRCAAIWKESRSNTGHYKQHEEETQTPREGNNAHRKKGNERMIKGDRGGQVGKATDEKESKEEEKRISSVEVKQ